MRQVIIARKDLQMTPGKLAAQCCHASLAFITSPMKTNHTRECVIKDDVFEDWICGIFTKTICEAKNKNQLMKAIEIAKELGLVENKDYFCIRDCCLTELTPEEVDENGVGRVLTCVGFAPLPDEIAHKISKKFQLYK